MIFGGTLALKGATEEQRALRPPHCADGCYACELEAGYIFERWVLELAPQRPIICKDPHVGQRHSER